MPSDMSDEGKVDCCLTDQCEAQRLLETGSVDLGVNWDIPACDKRIAFRVDHVDRGML